MKPKAKTDMADEPKTEQCASLCNGERHKDEKGAVINKPDKTSKGDNPNGKPGQVDVGEENGAISDNGDGDGNGAVNNKPDQNLNGGNPNGKHGQENVGEGNGAIGDNGNADPGGNGAVSNKHDKPDKNSIGGNPKGKPPGKPGHGDIGEEDGAIGDNGNAGPDKDPCNEKNNPDVDKDRRGQWGFIRNNLHDGTVADQNKVDGNRDERDQGFRQEDNYHTVNNDAKHAGLRRRPLRDGPKDEKENRDRPIRGIHKVRIGINKLVDGITEECYDQSRKAFSYIRNTTVGKLFALLWVTILKILLWMQRKIVQLCNKIREKRSTILKVFGCIVCVLLLFRIIAMIAETQDDVQDYQEFVKENNAKYEKIIKIHHEEMEELTDKNNELRDQLQAIEEGQETLIGDGGEIAAIKKEIINVKNDFENFMVKSQAHLMNVQNDMKKEVGQIRDDVGNVREDHKRIELALNNIEYNIRNIKNCGLLSRLFGQC